MKPNSLLLGLALTASSLVSAGSAGADIFTKAGVVLPVYQKTQVVHPSPTPLYQKAQAPAAPAAVLVDAPVYTKAQAPAVHPVPVTVPVMILPHEPVAQSPQGLSYATNGFTTAGAAASRFVRVSEVCPYAQL